MITEIPAMDFFDMLSSVGGTFGLFIGVCALTIIEFAQLICALAGCKLATMVSKHGAKSVNNVPSIATKESPNMFYSEKRNSTSATIVSARNNYGLADYQP
jgi:hypothetical protein